MTPDNDVYQESDPWDELSPGSLGRLALFADPKRCAADLHQWAGDGKPLAPWFRAVADALAAE